MTLLIILIPIKLDETWGCEFPFQPKVSPVTWDIIGSVENRSEMLRELLGGWIAFTGFLALDGKSVGWGRSRFETVSLDSVKMWCGVIKLDVTNVIMAYGDHGFKPRVNNGCGWTG